MSAELRAEIARQLLQIKAIKLRPSNPFTWASGLKSPIYCDNRTILSYPSTRKLVKDVFMQVAESYKPFNAIAGVATAGIPHGAILADALNLPFVYVRSKPKGHGMENLIEGHLRGNESVLMIEDLISTGGSCLKAARAIESRGCRIAGILAVFGYGLKKADDAFAEEDVQWETLTNYDQLLEEALAFNYITEEEATTLRAWKADPEGWSNSVTA